MQTNDTGVGLAISFLLVFPVGYLDLLLAFNNSIGGWVALSLVVPYLAYLVLAAILGWRGYGRLGKGVAIGGAVFSTLIVIGIFFLALAFGALADA